MDDSVLLHEDDGIALLEINRPQARNALNWEAQDLFAHAVRRIAQSAAARVVIITARGDQAFVSGGDLQELAQAPGKEDGLRLSEVMTHALDQLAQLPLPVLCAINGDAVGGGCEIVTACDLRLMARHARLRFGQVQVGLSTGWGGGRRLVAQIGQSRATDLLLTGRPVDAAEAHALGLVQRVVDAPGTVREAALALARDLQRLPADALATLKDVIRVAATSTPDMAAAHEQARFLALYGSSNHREALRAFVEKRAPDFNR